MVASTGKKRRAVLFQELCVACGCCVKVCPMQAIHISGGVMAEVDETLCVGCGKCAAACPASIIRILEVQA